MSKPQYERNPDTGRELYKLDVTTNKVVVLEHGYAKDENGLPYYPKDVDNNEFIDSRHGIIERYGRIVYPVRYADGKPNYEIDPNTANKQTYRQHKGKWIIGMGIDGHQYYATLPNGDEYYPPDKSFARKANGTPFYARKAAPSAPGAAAIRETIFPKDASNNEFYITLIDFSKPDTVPTKYAQDVDGNEIYPKRKVAGDLESETIINGVYAQKNNNVKYYPKDAHNNEFYLATLKPDGNERTAADIILNDYARTNDGKVILPTINNTFHVPQGKTPPVADANVLGRLIREETIVSSDWLTNVEKTPKPQVEPKAYKYRDRVTGVTKTITPPGASSGGMSFYKSWYFWIIGIVSLIVKSFGVWWFVFRNRQTYRVA